jgi:hypothetical protein
MTVHIEIFTGTMDQPGASALEHQSDRTMTGNFEVVAAKTTKIIQPVSDPKLAVAMYAAITPTNFHYGPKDHRLQGTIIFNNPPMSLAYDVFVRYGGKEHPFGEVMYHSPAIPCNYGTSGLMSDPPPAAVDVILRPSEHAAVDTVDIYSYWNQEMVFRNVPVAQP